MQVFFGKKLDFEVGIMREIKYDRDRYMASRMKEGWYRNMGMEQIYYQYIETPLGKLLAGGSETELLYLSSIDQPAKDWVCHETPVLAKTKKQLEEYFSGSRSDFTIPLAPQGTVFQRQVWKELQKIPYGEIRTYGQIAAAVGNPKASRAVGMANHNNPIMILIPCHRVIGSNGKLTGYAGGLDKKEFLLQLEKRFLLLGGR